MNFDVLLRLILDEATANKTEGGVNKAVKTVKKLDEVTKDVGKSARQAEKDAVKFANALAQKAKASAIALDKVGTGLESISKRALLLSAGVITGIFAFANKAIDNSERATDLTKKWNEEQENIANSGQRIGIVFAREILPALSKAADIADNIADVIEANPQLARAGINIAAITAGMATLGAVAGRLLQFASFFKTAQLAGGAGAVASATGATATTVASTSLLIAAPILGAMLGKEIGNAVQRALGMQESSWADIGRTIIQAVQIPTKLMLLALNGLGIISPETTRKINDLQNTIFAFGEQAKKTNDQTSGLVGVVKGHEKEEEIVNAFTQMKEDELAIEEKFQAERLNVITSSNASVLSAYQNNANTIASINAQAESQYNQLASNFNAAQAQAEASYQSERARMLRDGNLEIAKIEEERLENLRKLNIEHGDREEDLKANRDALGLALEQRDFERQKDEINRQAGREVEERRAQLELRLRDFDENYRRETEQRRAQFEQQVKENEERRIFELKRQEEEYKQELKRIEEQKNIRLNELNNQQNEERLKIRENFIKVLGDLDESLTAESDRRNHYYDLMLADAERFLQEYRNTMPSSGSGSGLSGGLIPSYDKGGYTPNGLIQSHKGEFIANQTTTKALESVVGGKLTQQSLLQTVMQGANVTWNDRRRFSGEYTSAMRRENKKDTYRTLKEVFA